MKALILNAQGQTEDAFALGKTALANDMKSAICWHVYGLLFRAAKNYEEAIKAYKFALRLDPESQQIQRDLALLQIHMRDYAGSVQSRKAMLQARPSFRMNWTALAIAHHLSGNLVTAERVLATYEETLKTPPLKSDTEHQDATLYKTAIIAEMGEIERALDHLDASSKHNYDRQAVLEMRASYLLQLGRKEEAEKAYRILLKRNAENRDYFDGLRSALNLDTSDIAALQKLYAEYAERDERNDTSRRVPLDFLEGEEFKSAVDPYLQRMLKRNVPSTFTNLKILYMNFHKRDAIQKLAEGYAEDIPNDKSEQTDGEKQDDERSRFELSVLYFLAQHYNYHRSRDLDRATHFNDRALARQPQNVDLHMTRARILKHAGDLAGAARAMDHARSLDERDRYINTKAAKYQLRHEQNAPALATLAKFTRPEAPGGALGDLVDMQAVWFLLADGASHLRQALARPRGGGGPRALGLALKRAAQVAAAFETWTEDQFDFHSFALRRGQARAYVAMLRWQDTLYAHPFFARAAGLAVSAYVALHDEPGRARDGGDDRANGVNGAGPSAAERKKAAQKARKAARERERLEQAEAERADARKTAGGGAGKEEKGPDGEAKKADPDPEGAKLVQTAEPLAEAMKFVGPWLEFSPRSLEAQRAGFEVFVRRSTLTLPFPIISGDFLDTRANGPLCRKVPPCAALPPRNALSRAIVAGLSQPALPPPPRPRHGFISPVLQTHRSSQSRLLPTTPFAARVGRYTRRKRQVPRRSCKGRPRRCDSRSKRAKRRRRGQGPMAGRGWRPHGDGGGERRR